MPAKRVSMRKLKECSCLKFDCGLSHEQIGRALGLSKGVVTKYLQRGRQAGLTWETATVLDEAACVARLLPAGKPPVFQRVVLDWAFIARALRRKGVWVTMLACGFVAAGCRTPRNRYIAVAAISEHGFARSADDVRRLLGILMGSPCTFP